ncbi:MAG TPA: BatD family protein [Woeseiaceae bacterium]|nr:BatD family protein [Woeseiaceae bacterium]
MVRLSRPHRAALTLLVFACGFVPGRAPAAVVASLDRSDIELNESFSLEVTVDTATDAEPDISAVEEDFYVLSQSDLRDTTIVNGQISRTRTWTYVLMAKKAGDFVLPPVIVGNEQSDPIPVTISPVKAAEPGRSDVFVVSEVDHTETLVRAQVLYRIKVYRAVATRQPRLSDPEISGVDTLVELVSDDPSYDSIIGGRNYDVVERVYALFPQASGHLSIAPALFQARVLRRGRITGGKIFQSEPIEIEVAPIPPPPAGYPDAAWFPAKSVELTEEWSREPADLRAGEPITRRVSVKAVGQLATQMPGIAPVDAAGIKIYPDKPELRVTASPAGILATRKDQYALIAVDPGDVRLPALELPWWDIDERRWQIAALPARTLRVAPSSDALPSPTAVADAAAPAVGHAADPGPLPSGGWRNLSAALAVLWLATLLIWWRSRRSAAPLPAAPAPTAPKAGSRSSLLRAARRAAERGDACEAKSALLKWGRLEWPGRPPLSIGDIAARLTEPAAAELRRLSDSSYGPGGEPWNGARLARALGSLKTGRGHSDTRTQERLPPLMPRT